MKEIMILIFQILSPKQKVKTSKCDKVITEIEVVNKLLPLKKEMRFLLLLITVKRPIFITR